MKILLSLLPLVLLAACHKPAEPKPSASSGTVISAQIHTLPEARDVIFNGKVMGQAPVKITVSSLDELTDKLSASHSHDGTVEQRIRHLANDNVVVTLVLDKNLSKMATALNLKKILVFDYGDEITFEFNKSELKPEFKNILTSQAEILKKHFGGIDIYVCGHSDDVGRHERNVELSLERANAVFKALAASGIPEKSMKVHGFGSDYPLDEKKTDAARARNRRTEIILGR